jgi:hypothetical protein
MAIATYVNVGNREEFTGVKDKTTETPVLRAIRFGYLAGEKL